MQKADYYHQIARCALRIADVLEPEAREAIEAEDTGAIDEVNDAIESRASILAFTEAFYDELGDLWVTAPIDTESARLMGEIIAVSDHQFRPTVEGRPKEALKEATKATMKADIRDGVSEILRQRVVEGSKEKASE